VEGSAVPPGCGALQASADSISTNMARVSGLRIVFLLSEMVQSYSPIVTRFCSRSVKRT
jgi:hypothetical protein